MRYSYYAFLLLLILASSVLAQAPGTSAAICSPAMAEEPRGPGDDLPPGTPLVEGRWEIRIAGHEPIVVKRDRSATIEGLAEGRHVVELRMDGRRVASMAIRLREGQMLCVRPGYYDGPQLRFCGPSCEPSDP